MESKRRPNQPQCKTALHRTGCSWAVTATPHLETLGAIGDGTHTLLVEPLPFGNQKGKHSTWAEGRCAKQKAVVTEAGVHTREQKVIRTTATRGPRHLGG